ncbi:MAG: response regulator [Vulcanimicrobiota bacterium]
MARYVLVVDDERECLELASISLRLFGNFEVYQATDGPTALAKARELRPDAILLDYYLSNSNGGEVITSLRQDPELANIPIVVYSGSPEAARADAAVTDDIQILAKPLNPESLSSVLKKICGDSSNES